MVRTVRSSVLNTVLTNDLTASDGRRRYTLMPHHETGGVDDDAIAYRVSDREFQLIPTPPTAPGWRRHLRRVAGSCEVGCDPESPSSPCRVRPDQVLLGLLISTTCPFGAAEVAGHDARSAAPATRGSVASRSSPHRTGRGVGGGGRRLVQCRGLGARDTLRTGNGDPLHGHELLRMFRPGGRRSVGRWSDRQGEFRPSRRHRPTPLEKVVGCVSPERGIPGPTWSSSPGTGRSG